MLGLRVRGTRPAGRVSAIHNGEHRSADARGLPDVDSSTKRKTSQRRAWNCCWTWCVVNGTPPNASESCGRRPISTATTRESVSKSNPDHRELTPSWPACGGLCRGKNCPGWIEGNQGRCLQQSSKRRQCPLRTSGLEPGLSGRTCLFSVRHPRRSSGRLGHGVPHVAFTNGRRNAVRRLFLGGSNAPKIS